MYACFLSAAMYVCVSAEAICVSMISISLGTMWSWHSKEYTPTCLRNKTRDHNELQTSGSLSHDSTAAFCTTDRPGMMNVAGMMQLTRTTGAQLPSPASSPPLHIPHLSSGRRPVLQWSGVHIRLRNCQTGAGVAPQRLSPLDKLQSSLARRNPS